jgi:hypothetical protein
MKMTRWAVVLAGAMMGASLQAGGQTDPARRPAAVMVPAGTTVIVRLSDEVDVDVAHAGMTVRARVDDPVMIDGEIVIPRGALAVVQAVHVAQSGQFKGSDQVSLKLNSVSFGGRSYQVATDYATMEGSSRGARTARRVGGSAGLGAIVGGVAGGGTGALIGTTLGAVAGTALAATGQEHLRVPAETRLRFTLSSSVRIQP